MVIFLVLRSGQLTEPELTLLPIPGDGHRIYSEIDTRPKQSCLVIPRLFLSETSIIVSPL